MECFQHNKLILPVSAPNNNKRFKGNTAMDVSRPLKASDRNLVLEKQASISIDVCTPIRFAVVPDINSLLYTFKQCTGSIVPLRTQKLLQIS